MKINLRKILCPTDLTPQSAEALRYGAALAKSYGASLSVCYCVGASLFADAALGEAALERVDTHRRSREVFARLMEKNVRGEDMARLEWDGFVMEGDDIGEAITKEAADRHIDLIVMRSRRRPRRAALLGSIAESVCRTAPCPVFVTHPDERNLIDEKTGEVRIKRVLVAYDFSDYSEIALRYGLTIAQEYQSDVHLLHVLPPMTTKEPEIAWSPLETESPYHKAARRLQKAVPAEVHLWCNVTHAVNEGYPYREVLAYAEKNEMDLICIGAHGAGFGMKALFGSNVDRVLRQAKCPVLVARPLRPTNFTPFGISSQ